MDTEWPEISNPVTLAAPAVTVFYTPLWGPLMIAHENFFRNKALSDGVFSSTTSWGLAFPNSHMVPLSISHTTRVTQTINIGLKTRLLRVCLGLGDSVGLSVLSYSKWVVCSLSSKAWLLFKKLLFVEYLSFRDEGIHTILLLGYRLCSWFKFTSSYRFCLVLVWKRMLIAVRVLS